MPPAKKPSTSKTESQEPLHSAGSKDIWLAGLGAMAQAQAQARAQGSKAFEALVAEGLAFQRKSQVAAQEKIHEAAGLAQPIGAKVDRLEHLFEDRVARALKSLGLPTAQEVAELQDRVAALEKALAKTKAAPASKAAPRKRATPAK